MAQAARADGLGRPQEEAGHEAPRVGSTAEERHALWRRLEENPEATLQEHREAWERERGVRVSVAMMSRAIRRLGWTYYKKKTLGSSAERDEEARALWRERVARLDPAGRLVFVDECGSHIGLSAPLRARAPKGERALGEAPRNRGKNVPIKRAASVEFSLILPYDAPDGSYVKGTYPAATDGLWVSLPALSKGKHKVEFGGDFANPFGSGSVHTMTTYNLPVK